MVFKTCTYHYLKCVCVYIYIYIYLFNTVHSIYIYIDNVKIWTYIYIYIVSYCTCTCFIPSTHVIRVLYGVYTCAYILIDAKFDVPIHAGLRFLRDHVPMWIPHLGLCIAKSQCFCSIITGIPSTDFAAFLNQLILLNLPFCLLPMEKTANNNIWAAD